MIRIFMKDNTIVSLGVPMLRMQLLGMVFVAIVLVTTCTFQSAGMARNAFLLSISRQGVIFAIVLAIASHTIGYQGILLSQAISDLLTAVLAIALYRTSVAKELHT
jgi:Na+-driven multidrug efflux pump